MRPRGGEESEQRSERARREELPDERRDDRVLRRAARRVREKRRGGDVAPIRQRRQRGVPRRERRVRVAIDDVPHAHPSGGGGGVGHPGAAFQARVVHPRVQGAEGPERVGDREVGLRGGEADVRVHAAALVARGAERLELGGENRGDDAEDERVQIRRAGASRELGEGGVERRADAVQERLVVRQGAVPELGDELVEDVLAEAGPRAEDAAGNGGVRRGGGGGGGIGGGARVGVVVLDAAQEAAQLHLALGRAARGGERERGRGVVVGANAGGLVPREGGRGRARRAGVGVRADSRRARGRRGGGEGVHRARDVRRGLAGRVAARQAHAQASRVRVPPRVEPDPRENPQREHERRGRGQVSKRIPARQRQHDRDEGRHAEELREREPGGARQGHLLALRGTLHPANKTTPGADRREAARARSADEEETRADRPEASVLNAEPGARIVGSPRPQ